MSIEFRDFERSLWQGRIDAEQAGDTRRWHQQIQPWQTASPAGASLVGFACDAGIRRNLGRPGAAAGPNVIRRALANLALHSSNAVYDAGDIVVSSTDDLPGNLEAGQAALGQRVAALLDDGHRVIVLGGGHEVAYGSHLGIARHVEANTRVGIINFDAHFDLRDGEQGNSGTPFRQIAEHCAVRQHPFHYLCLGINEGANTAALFATARELHAEWRLDSDMNSWQISALRKQVDDFIAGMDRIHLSIDLDVFPAAVAPGVSAPAARGVSLDVIECLLGDIVASGKLMLADIAEYNPQYDIDSRTARLAARLAGRLMRVA
jgi:formiminoglutamase